MRHYFSRGHSPLGKNPEQAFFLPVVRDRHSIQHDTQVMVYCMCKHHSPLLLSIPPAALGVWMPTAPLLELFSGKWTCWATVLKFLFYIPWQTLLRNKSVWSDPSLRHEHLSLRRIMRRYNIFELVGATSLLVGLPFHSTSFCRSDYRSDRILIVFVFRWDGAEGDNEGTAETLWCKDRMGKLNPKKLLLSCNNWSWTLPLRIPIPNQLANWIVTALSMAPHCFRVLLQKRMFTMSLMGWRLFHR